MLTPIRKTIVVSWDLWADRRSSPVVLGLEVLQKLLAPLQRRMAERMERKAMRAVEPG